MKRTYTPPKINYERRRKSVAVPDQSLSIQEIVKRFVRGIPVDVIQRKPIYLDQNEFDLEKLNRMDFGEKAEYANTLAQRAADLKQDLENRSLERKTFAQEQANASAKAAIKAKSMEETTT